MAVFLQRILVPFEYPVYFTAELFAPQNGHLAEAISRLEPDRRHRVFAVIDDGVAAACPGLVGDLVAYAEHHRDRMQLCAEPLVLPGGEACKNDPELVPALYARFRELGLDRHAFVMIVGGGALLDVVGYAAATTHRGVRVIRVPTTVLGQADSAVGVKNGVNLAGSKNFVGTFAPPFAVLNDPELLRTLDVRDRRAGMAEAVKVALVRDADFFTWLESHAGELAAGAEPAVAHLCRRSAELHLAHIRDGGDPFELGSARPLDFGHWSAHKLESLTDHRLRHGEAVAIGMAIDTIYARRLGLLDEASAGRVLGLLDQLGFRLWDEALRDPTAVLAGLAEFREHLGGELTITLLTAIGRGHEVHEMDEGVVRAAMAELGESSMKLATPGAPHLTYCTNIHAGESWREVREVVAGHVTAVKARICPDRPFGVGLRLSAAAADELARPDELAGFQRLLADAGLYVFTINGFPHGAFHATRVKEQVYQPDWLDDARLAYSDRLAHILAALVPDGQTGSVSTVPGAFKPRVRGDDDARALAARLARHAATLHKIHGETGKTITLALEPEPCCFLETTAEAVDFFTRFVFTTRVPGLGASESEAVLRRHLGVCLDTCHLAVEFEEPAAALAALAGAGIAIHKIQLSAGLAVDHEHAGLARFADDVYLHQVVERSPEGLRRWVDLPEALASDRRGEWRVHFHVPLHRERLGAFRSTQAELGRLLDLVRDAPPTSHLEVETYTWDVLPAEHREADVVAEITRELRWVLDRLEQRA